MRADVSVPFPPAPYVTVSAALAGFFDICGGARCCCPLTVSLTAERCCRKVITEMDGTPEILNTQTIT